MTMTLKKKKSEIPYEEEELQAIFSLGILYYQIGQWDNARLIFLGLHSLNALDIKPLLMLGELLLVCGEYEAAIAHFKKCLSEKETLDFLWGLSRAYLMADRSEKARFCLTEILENPEAVDQSIFLQAQMLLNRLQGKGPLNPP